MGPETTSAAATTSTAVVGSSLSSTSALLEKHEQKPISSSSTCLAPGFRFHPTDEELVIYYLKRKICNKPFRYDVISDVDIYRTEPWFLAGKSKLKSRDQEWYFFSLLDRKYANGARMNRATGEGYWKATGNDRVVRHDSQPVGLKKTLVFHFGRAPEGKRTNWVMHEYRLMEKELEKCGDIKDAYVLCRVFHKANMGPPTGNRYAPFVEQEWDDSTIMMPGEETREETTNGIKDKEKDIVLPSPQNQASLEEDELPSKTRYLLAVCKSERLSDSKETCVADDEATPLPDSKRKKIIDLNLTDSVGSESSPKIANGSCSSAATSAVDSTSRLSALVEYSLMESCRIPQSASDSSNINSSMPPECYDFIHSLQEEIYRVTVDREKLRLDMLHVRSMLNSLQAQLARMNKENSDLRDKLQEIITSKIEDAERKRKAHSVTVGSET